MPLQLKVVNNIDDLQVVAKEKQFKKIKLQMGKTLDGSILITGHQNMNVVVIPDKGKIIAMPKGEFSDD
ncbi:hypothetical protein EBU94_08985, partial [bacterium]|nr:hypothetical protein [bacterium]